MVLTAFITDSTPLCPPEFLAKEILILPNGKSMSSWTTIKLSAFFTEVMTLFKALPDLFIKVSGRIIWTFSLPAEALAGGGTADFSLCRPKRLFSCQKQALLSPLFHKLQNGNPPGVMPSHFVFLPRISQTNDVTHRV